MRHTSDRTRFRSPPEIVQEGKTGTIVQKEYAEQPHPKTGQLKHIVNTEATAIKLAQALVQINYFHRVACRKDFEDRFTATRMCKEHIVVYRKLMHL